MPELTDQELRDRWGTALQALLDERGWSQTRLAEESGVPQTKISQIVRKVSGGSNRTRQALARALGVEVHDIFGYPPVEELAS